MLGQCLKAVDTGGNAASLGRRVARGLMVSVTVSYFTARTDFLCMVEALVKTLVASCHLFYRLTWSDDVQTGLYDLTMEFTEDYPHKPP
jgi:hypothetical protein